MKNMFIPYYQIDMDPLNDEPIQFEDIIGLNEPLQDRDQGQVKDYPLFDLFEELACIDPIKYKSYWEKRLPKIPEKWSNHGTSIIDLFPDFFQDLISCIDILHKREPIIALYHQFKQDCSQQQFYFFSGYMYAITKDSVYRFVYATPVIKDGEAVLNIPDAGINDFKFRNHHQNHINSIMKALLVHTFKPYVNVWPLISYCSSLSKGLIGTIRNCPGQVSKEYLDDLMSSSLDIFISICREL
jgi:hypothetical protein